MPLPARYARSDCATSLSLIASSSPAAISLIFTSGLTPAMMLDRFQQRPSRPPSPKPIDSRGFPSRLTQSSRIIQIRGEQHPQPRPPTLAFFSVGLQGSISPVLASIWKTLFRGSMRPSLSSSRCLRCSPTIPVRFPNKLPELTAPSNGDLVCRRRAQHWTPFHALGVNTPRKDVLVDTVDQKASCGERLGSVASAPHLRTIVAVHI